MPAWTRAVTHKFELTEVFRQRGDGAFCRVLEELRYGELSEASAALLLPRLTASVGPQATITRLMPLRAQVERVNARELAALPGELALFEAPVKHIIRLLNKHTILLGLDRRTPNGTRDHTFEARDQGNSELLDQLSGAPRFVELRVGALVYIFVPIQNM